MISGAGPVSRHKYLIEERGVATPCDVMRAILSSNGVQRMYRRSSQYLT
jgi:hypothetical protein